MQVLGRVIMHAGVMQRGCDPAIKRVNHFKLRFPADEMGPSEEEMGWPPSCPLLLISKDTGQLRGSHQSKPLLIHLVLLIVVLPIAHPSKADKERHMSFSGKDRPGAVGHNLPHKMFLFVLPKL
jgi:hypothetical protein